MIDSLTAFVKDEFPGLVDHILSPCAAEEFTDLLMVLIMSHRFEKQDPCLKDTFIEFSIVRDPMYKYSCQAQEKFLNFPAYSFLLMWFAVSPTGLLFA